MATQTTNFNLIKDGTTDYYDVATTNANLDKIDTEIKNAKDRADEAFQSASDGKQVVATAITGKGVQTSSSDTFQKMATNISAIETDKTGDATAVAGDILAPKTAHARGIELTGTMVDNGSVGTKNLTTEGATYTIPAGYHNGLGKIKAVITGLIASVIKAGTTVGGILGTFTSDATAIASQMLSGVTAYVKGNKITGTIPVINPDTSDQIATTAVSVGEYSGAGAMHAYIAVPPNSYLNGVNWVRSYQPDLRAENILYGKSIFGIAGSLMPSKYASGITPTVSGKMFYNRGTSSTSSQAALVVSGLTFKAKAILIFTASSGSIQENITMYKEEMLPISLYDGQGRYGNSIRVISHQGGAQSTNITVWTPNINDCYVNDTGFCFPVLMSGNCLWFAMG